jgi:fumarate reductase iron-sulfur subunit
MKEADVVRVEVVRAEPGEVVGPDGPRTSVYEVPVDERMSVLDVLRWIKDNLDPTLTFRWSCAMAVCGSCGVMVNGRPVLGCETFVRGFRTSGLRIGPLEHFEVQRDLAVETDGFLGKLASVAPWLIEPAGSEAGPAAGDTPTGPPTVNLQTAAQMGTFGDLAQCIDCMLCYAACPQLDVVPGFMGPAAVATARRWDTDSRDGGELARANLLDTEEGVWPCIQIGSCTQACPKGVDPARALRDAQRVAEETWEARQE